jgi:hypothetical protein
MNFDSGNKAARLRDDSGDREPFPPVKPMGDPVKPNRMETGIRKHDLKNTSRRRVVIEYRPNVGLHAA